MVFAKGFAGHLQARFVVLALLAFALLLFRSPSIALSFHLSH